MLENFVNSFWEWFENGEAPFWPLGWSIILLVLFQAGRGFYRWIEGVI